MAQFNNSTHTPDEWKFDHNSIPFKEGLIVIFMFLYGLKIQLRGPSRQRNLQWIQKPSGKIVQLLNTSMNWCARLQDFEETYVEKQVLNARVIPYENKIATKVEKKKTDKHPWDMAHEIMKEQEQAALAVKWAIIPIEVLMDEQFLNVLHSIEKITDATPLRDAAKQLPRQLYGIIQAHEQMTRIPAELTDQLVFDVAKTYYYSIIQSLCKLIKSIQQGQRTTLISLAKMVQDQKDEIETYQALLKLPEEMKRLQQQMEKLKKHVNIQLERTDKRTSVTSVTISELQSQVHGLAAILEANFDDIPPPYQPSWVFPGDIVEINAPEDDILFHEEREEPETLNDQLRMGEDLAIGGEIQGNRDNTPQRLSPSRRYIPGGAERSDSSQSSTTTDGEETVEERLAGFFDNPSYQAADPALQQPVEPEEDWGDTPPGLLPIPITLGPPPQTVRALKRQRYLQRRRERRRQDEWERDQS